MNRTPWFSGAVKPARPGVYERKDPDNPEEIVYARWTGFEWKEFWVTAEDATRDCAASCWQVGPHSLEWRGLTERAK